MNEAIFKRHRQLNACPPALLFYIVYRRLVEQGFAPTRLWVKDKIARRTEGFSPPNLSEVAPNLYVGGQHRQRGLQAMRDLGITAVVNMREEFDDASRGLGLDHYLWLPTTDDTPPTVEDLAQGAVFIHEQRSAGRGVYIHCASGVGRAPTMAAAYLVAQGATPHHAWETLREGRPFVRPTPPQRAVVKTFAEQVRSSGHTEDERASPNQRVVASAAPEEEQGL